ncbi:MAG: inorganic phosphate transporter [Deltaproteobacteria bacterium]|nr:inorganic phosphate transporter [Deltaproteobacteria bacterium]
MSLFLFAVIILASLAVFDLIVGVSNDAVNFLNSSIGSRVAPRHVIMVIAGLGILAGVTFSSGMMEVARKGIFHPRFFTMPELMTLFLAVMLTDVLLLDLFNTFGLPTSTTVSIVFELLGAAVAVSLLKIHVAGDSYATVVEYINTAKAFSIIMGILLSVVIAFFFGVVCQFVTRLVFTFDYQKRLKRYSGVWGGLALSIITYFILIKGAKGASFLTPETVIWVNTHTWMILYTSFLFFAILFQLLALFTQINVLKPIVLIGTFALAMAFAGNDLVNFIGVPLAGMNAYNVASETINPLMASMEALQQPIQSNTFLLLVAGAIMVITLWMSRKARTVTQTEVSLGRQDEGVERFGSSTLSRTLVGMVYGAFSSSRRLIPISLRKTISGRIDPGEYRGEILADGRPASFDLVRASVNLIVASAVISFATSLKLPLSTTYVTFMVAMGTSLSDQAWGRESAVYRVTGVMTVIGGWFFTALAAFTTAFVFALIIYYLEALAVVGLVLLVVFLIWTTYQYHRKKEEERGRIEALSLDTVCEADTAIQTSFEQTGHFLRDISDNIGLFYQALHSEDLERLRKTRSEAEKIQKWADTIVENIFKTLSLLNKGDMDGTHQYSYTLRDLQSIAESHMNMITRTCEHFENYHAGFLDSQKQELRQIKTFLTRLLWNTSIMLTRRKRVDYDYITNQCEKLKNLTSEFSKNQVRRIQRAESKIRRSMLFFAILENSLSISEHTQNLLAVFRDSFDVRTCEQSES